MAPSQWQIESNDEATNVCEERRAKLKHFKDALAPIETAYPFNTETNSEERQLGKVYQVPDANGSNKYVLASSSGTGIIDVEDQGVILDDAGNDVGCYQLSGTDDKIVKSCGDANMTDGVIEVDLSWKSPNIDLTLSVVKDGAEVGALDDAGKCPKEHWYIAPESEVTAGEYYVHVTAEDISNIDAALLPETIKLKIDAPSGGLNISIDIPSADLLEMGAVAKIIVTKPEGGGVGVSVEVKEHPDVKYTATKYKYDDEGKEYNYEVVSLLNIVELGPIRNAQIEIMSLSEADFGQVVYNGYTSSGDTLDTNGLMLLPSTFKASVTDTGLYLISATGGEDVDTDDDLNMDATPTSNFGTIHAIVSGANIKENGLKVNILTELGYQVSKHLLLNAEDALSALPKLDEAAQALLNTDMNNDSIIDHTDLHAWVPSFDKETLLFDYNIKIHPIVLKIYNADDIYEDAYNLIYPNTRPVADAGEDITVNFGESVTLDGSRSYDSDGYITRYIWSDAYSNQIICDGSEPTCVVGGKNPGSFMYKLTVYDDHNLLDQSTLTVKVIGEKIYQAVVVAGNGSAGYSGDGGLATAAKLNTPGSIIIDANNNILFSDKRNNVIRKIDNEGTITTFAGNGIWGDSDNVYRTDAGLSWIDGLAIDETGVIFFTETYSSKVKKIDLTGTVISMIDDNENTFWQPQGLEVDKNGNLYIADSLHSVIKKVTPAGDITIIAGNSDYSYGYAGDGGLAIEALLYAPGNVAFDMHDNLYIADGKCVIRKVDTSGIITTIAGNNDCGYSGEKGPAISASLSGPRGIVFDKDGNLYFIDYKWIRKIDTSGIITTVAGEGITTFNSENSSVSQSFQPQDIAIDVNGALFVTDTINDRIIKIY
ncbi:MAG: PKD domain-containing protein [Sulfurimonadaceae bacterium]